MPGYRALVLAGLASIGAGLPAWALEDADSQTLQQIVVVWTTPVPGMTVDVDKVPGNVQTLSSTDLGPLFAIASVVGGRLAGI
jgi:hypothetical protein